MKLQNIYNDFNKIYYTIRDEDGLKIKEDSSFQHYFYEPDPNGEYTGYDGTKLTKIFVENPHDIKKRRTNHSWEADVLFTKRYCIDRIPKIEPSNTRWIAFDIETPIEDKKYLDPRSTKEAPYLITFIVAYDNYTQEYKEFDYRDYKTEYDILEDFCKWIQKRKPDLLLAWNVLDFDWPYLWYKFPDIAKKISPIGQEEWKEAGDIHYPALVTVLDLMGLDHKFTLGKRDSYALTNVLSEEFDEDKENYKDVDFVNDEDRVKEKCLRDVKAMVRLIEKNDYINYFDQIRLDTGCLWDDLPSKKLGFKWHSMNSRPIDMMFLREAKELSIILPSKNRDNDEDHEYIGAYREIFQKGVFRNEIKKYDLTSAYPSMIKDFCLDPSNISEEGLPINLYSLFINQEGKEERKIIGTHNFKQNSNTILPTVVGKLLKAKNELKEALNNSKPDTEEFKILERKYNSCKARINSLYGVLGNSYFRLYDYRVAETNTFLVRDLLIFIRDRLNKLGHEVVYLDTDSVFCKTEKELTDLLNKLVTEWGYENYGKKVSVRFDYEGYFEKLFLVALCRYIGYVRTPSNKLKTEIKGLQIIRRNAPEFSKRFQKNILNYIMDKNPKEKVFQRIEKWMNIVKKVDFQFLGTPCKLSKKREDYAKKEIFFRGIDNTEEMGVNFEVEVDQKFWYINIADKKKDVLVFDQRRKDHINNIDYNAIIEKQILNVLIPIFDGLDWGKELLDFAENHEIILGSQHRKTLLEKYDHYEELKDYYSARNAKKRIKDNLTKDTSK